MGAVRVNRDYYQQLLRNNKLPDAIPPRNAGDPTDYVEGRILVDEDWLKDLEAQGPLRRAATPGARTAAMYAPDSGPRTEQSLPDPAKVPWRWEDGPEGGRPDGKPDQIAVYVQQVERAADGLRFQPVLMRREGLSKALGEVDVPAMPGRTSLMLDVVFAQDTPVLTPRERQRLADDAVGITIGWILANDPKTPGTYLDPSAAPGSQANPNQAPKNRIDRF